MGEGFWRGEFVAAFSGDEGGGEGDEVAETFHDGVGVDAVAEEVEVDGEGHEGIVRGEWGTMNDECRTMKGWDFGIFEREFSLRRMTFSHREVAC